MMYSVSVTLSVAIAVIAGAAAFFSNVVCYKDFSEDVIYIYFSLIIAKEVLLNMCYYDIHPILQTYPALLETACIRHNGLEKTFIQTTSADINDYANVLASIQNCWSTHQLLKSTPVKLDQGRKTIEDQFQNVWCRWTGNPHIRVYGGSR